MAAERASLNSKSRFRAAVVQAGSIPLDTGRCLDKLCALAADASKEGAQLVVFPEAFVGGYPKGQDFGVTVGMRTDDGRDRFRAYWENAIEIPGPATEVLAAAARDNHIHLVTGVVEREGGTLYCTAVIFGPDGQLLG